MDALISRKAWIPRVRIDFGTLAMTADPLARLVRALQDPTLYDHPVEGFTVLQTHISYILLTGPYAYKLKKPVNLGFLDFSSLDRRRFYAEEEVRLNRRLSPDLYVGVIPITGSATAPRLGGEGETIEYAVKMVQFDIEQQLDRVVDRGELRIDQLRQLADDVARFHGTAAVAGPETDFGIPAHVRHPIEENFAQIRPCLAESSLATRSKALQDWSEQTLNRLEQTFLQRKRDGAVRECHGDMHLANMALHEGRVMLFDCLEFNENLRWIDVMSEVAFLLMDLDYRNRRDLARHFLNRYLERAGDYAGLALLRHYLVYRAMVRAKVACIRSCQSGVSADQKRSAASEFAAHLALADGYTRAISGRLLITHGLSGSGKTTITDALIGVWDAVRVRSDIERKRLHGLGAEQRSGSGVATGLYTAAATDTTYHRLEEAARAIIRAGYSAVVDATFLSRSRRRRFALLAEELGVPFVILHCTAPETELRRRIQQRLARGGDASEAGLDVLAHQLATEEPFDEVERTRVVEVDSREPVAAERLLQRVEAL
jgi:aminoglycoside phosphotransferase family enzyme/predicted kinase